MIFFASSGSTVFETLILVVSIKGRASPKFESVTIPISLPVRGIDLLPRSSNAYATRLIDNLSPNEIK